MPVKKPTFLELLEQPSPIILDGATGTVLDDMGLVDAAFPWTGRISLDYPDELLSLHQQYIAAGANIVATATFRTSPHHFKNAGEEPDLWAKATRQAVLLAKKAAKVTTLVAGSIGPLEDCFAKHCRLAANTAAKLHLPLMTQLAREQVDILWLETFGHYAEVQGALQSAQKVHDDFDIPIALSVTTQKNGSMFDGTSLETVVKLAVRHNVSALLVNCIPCSHVQAALTTLMQCPLPFGIYANLGNPEANQDWHGSAYLTPSEYAAYAAKWLSQGAKLLGACCGSFPAHIQALASTL